MNWGLLVGYGFFIVTLGVFLMKDTGKVVLVRWFGRDVWYAKMKIHATCINWILCLGVIPPMLFLVVGDPILLFSPLLAFTVYLEMRARYIDWWTLRWIGACERVYWRAQRDRVYRVWNYVRGHGWVLPSGGYEDAEELASHLAKTCAPNVVRGYYRKWGLEHLYDQSLRQNDSPSSQDEVTQKEDNQS